MTLEEYREIEIPGKHGRIKLKVPNRKPTEEELQQLHRVVAETIVNTMRHKKPSSKEKGTYN